MRTGVAYLGHHNPKHLESDLREVRASGCDDLLLAAQENDFAHLTGKLGFTPQIAREHGLRPIVIFWGALNLFGGGRSSQFLLEHPEGFQVDRDGELRAEGCYVNPACVGRIKEMIDEIAGLGFQGYFVDEPTPLRECFCPSCRRRFEGWYEEELTVADGDVREEFRRRCVIDYVETIASYCKEQHPALETICCVMPSDRELWETLSRLESLDNLGTDIYWVNEDRDVEEMTPLVRELDGVCKKRGKRHHEWLQCWGVRGGKEHRIVEQGKVLVRERPDALYVWAWEGQVGTTESCEDPARAWSSAREVLALAKERSTDS